MNNTVSRERLPHAALNLQSRHLKAQKIERLLNLASLAQPIRMLEIGCGSGGIAHYFATHKNLSCDVAAVDVHDNRQVSDGYDYHQVQGIELPFDAENFDVIISNHVIEHVGDANAQLSHLKEIRRVMKSQGKDYLATPNRWMLTEPHYRVKFLSWLPRRWRSPYLRWIGKGNFYDCEPLEMREFERLLATSGLAYRNLCIEALRATFDIEHSRKPYTKALTSIPDAMVRPLIPVIPTLIYQIEKART